MPAESDPSAVEEPSDGLAPYWIETAVVSASGVTHPLIVALVVETAVVGPVVATGGMTIRPMAFGDPLSVNHNAPFEPQRAVGTRENRVAVPEARRVDALGDLGDLAGGCDLGNRR